MSADNWDICPRCFAAAKDAHAANLVRIAQMYGQVPIAEFDAERDSLTAPEEEDFRTFREDYEFYGVPEGVLRISYSGQCIECDLALHLEDSKEIWAP